MQLPTIRQLEYLVAVHETRSFHRAAEACHVSQPGLSQQIQQLEALLDVQLFERSRRRVLVTQAGERLARRAKRILDEAKELAETAHALARPLTGPLRLGVIPTIAPYWLPRVLPRVRRRHPELQLWLREDRTERLVEALEAGELDLLLLALDVPLGTADSLTLFEDRFAAAVPRGHRLARRKRLREGDLDGESVLLLEDGHCLREHAWSVCGRAGASEWGDFRASSLSTLVQMVASGVGLTLVPEMAVEAEAVLDEDLVVIPFGRPFPSRRIGLAWRRDSPRQAEFATLGEALGRGAPAS
ncbi:MAG: LysR substrate-binding domain-containing protein [Myxococcota bacterium]